MKYAKFDTIEEYASKVTEINTLRGYPREGTLTYASDMPQVDVDGKFILPVVADLEFLFEELYAFVTYPTEEYI